MEYKLKTSDIVVKAYNIETANITLSAPDSDAGSLFYIIIGSLQYVII